MEETIEVRMNIFNALMQYLGTQPYAEVAGLINALQPPQPQPPQPVVVE